MKVAADQTIENTAAPAAAANGSVGCHRCSCDGVSLPVLHHHRRHHHQAGVPSESCRRSRFLGLTGSQWPSMVSPRAVRREPARFDQPAMLGTPCWRTQASGAALGIGQAQAADVAGAGVQRHIGWRGGSPARPRAEPGARQERGSMRN